MKKELKKILAAEAICIEEEECDKEGFEADNFHVVSFSFEEDAPKVSVDEGRTLGPFGHNDDKEQRENSHNGRI